MAVSADWTLFVAFHLPAEIFSNLILGIRRKGLIQELFSENMERRNTSCDTYSNLDEIFQSSWKT